MPTAPSTTMDSKTKRNSVDSDREESKVILFNCNCHTFDSVIHQLVYAIHCSHEEANRFAHIVHVNGKATVFRGTVEECDRVADKLAEIGLIVRIAS